MKVPFVDFGYLDITDVREKNAPHVDVLRLLVVVTRVGTIALCLPLLMTLIAAGSLNITTIKYESAG